jgi:hypothetical protein
MLLVGERVRGEGVQQPGSGGKKKSADNYRRNFSLGAV